MKHSVFLVFILYLSACTAARPDSNLRVGAERMECYLPVLEGKRIGLCVNHTSMVNHTHLLDTLLSKQVNVVKIFCPEHGFRGNAEAGEHINNSIDASTGLPVISLYGSNKKPTSEQIADLDIIVFDIQDVGARFYTYISTLTYIMEAAAENKVTVMVMDRPNPNGYWVDGCVLKSEYRSFVGMHSVPINHGMTMAEYARMVNEEGWLANKVKCKLLWVRMENYTHALRYQLPIAPSPNLSCMEAVYLYPTLCLLEGTSMSLGRGTDAPFTMYGQPDFKKGDFYFTPKSIEHVVSNPPYCNEECRGVSLKQYSNDSLKNHNFIDIAIIIDAYNNCRDQKTFFNSFFNKLAGNAQLMQQIKDGKSAEEIRLSWNKELNAFKQKRKKYLLYPDF
ncbi:MAG: DUF1343 domain-containing protein [Bacteroidales bacterium]|nr:DUF1343 domain-containing protein [Bacteroidales bacterium]